MRAPSERRVFEGLKVLELGSGAAGPVATRYLAEHGATVVRVESAKRPDFLRVLWLTPDAKHGLDGSPMFVLLNPNKLSLALDLKHEAAHPIARRLVAWADVVCENFAPGAMERFGLGYEACRAINPRVVMASGCLFGQTGPHRAYPGFGAQGSALSGFNHLTGWPDRPSQGPAGTITDSLAPRYVALAIVGALLERERTGLGQHIDVSQVEAAVYGASEVMARYSARGEVVVRAGNRDEAAAPHAVFPCAGSERWIAIACFADDEWRALCAAIGDTELARDARFASFAARKHNEDALEERIAAWTRGFEAHALMAKLQTAGVRAGVVQDYADLLADPQLAARGHFVELAHEHLGAIPFERSGFRLSDASAGYETPGPHLGEHTQRVLAELLGLTADEIGALERAGALA